MTADKIKAVGVRGFELALGFKDVGVKEGLGYDNTWKVAFVS